MSNEISDEQLAYLLAPAGPGEDPYGGGVPIVSPQALEPSGGGGFGAGQSVAEAAMSIFDGLGGGSIMREVNPFAGMFDDFGGGGGSGRGGYGGYEVCPTTPRRQGLDTTQVCPVATKPDPNAGRDYVIGVTGQRVYL